MVRIRVSRVSTRGASHVAPKVPGSNFQRTSITYLASGKVLNERSEREIMPTGVAIATWSRSSSPRSCVASPDREDPVLLKDAQMITVGDGASRSMHVSMSPYRKKGDGEHKC